MAAHAKRKSRKKFVWLFTAVLLLGVGGTAYAYWTAGGSGTGTATTGTSSAVTVVQTSTVSNLQPGAAAQTLTGTFNNPNTGPVYVATVTASIDSVTKAVGAPAGTCDATDYTLSNATMTVAASTFTGW